MDHFLLLVWHALLVSVFFAYLWRNDPRARRALFLKTLLIMPDSPIIDSSPHCALIPPRPQAATAP